MTTTLNITNLNDAQVTYLSSWEGNPITSITDVKGANGAGCIWSGFGFESRPHCNRHTYDMLKVIHDDGATELFHVCAVHYYDAITTYEELMDVMHGGDGLLPDDEERDDSEMLLQAHDFWMGLHNPDERSA